MTASRLLMVAGLALLLAGCSVAGTPSVGLGVTVGPTSTSATTTLSPARTPATARTTTTAPTATPTSNTAGQAQSAPADFTAYNDLNFAARWNDTTQDPAYQSTCDALADQYPYCWSAQVWNGNVVCPNGVTVDVDLYDGTKETLGAKIGTDFGISLAKDVRPYSSTVVHIFTDTVFPSGNASAEITSIQCGL